MKKIRNRIIFVFVLPAAVIVTLYLFQKPWETKSGEHPIQLTVKVLSTLPHDAQAYTQGLIYYRGSLYESTGLHSRSSLRQMDTTGKILRRTDLPANLFGEGLGRVGNKLIQLTWKEGAAMVYDLTTLKRIAQFNYGGEGWGLCFDGKLLIMSNGSDTLSFRDPETFKVIRKTKVTISGKSLPQLNELEWAEGSIYSNVWPTDQIVRIDPQSGHVIAVIHTEGLLKPEERAHAEVLNGIAYNPDKRTFLLTGKFWPALFEAEFVPITPKS